ncbi:MAG: 2-hydroxychromene-2-carboxylate isomerase [Pseudomonadota bacterium]
MNADADITFWFDVHSPWCYLASQRIGDLARRTGSRLEWRPLHLANLMTMIDGMQPLNQSPARVAWYEQDLKDHAALYGLPLRPHPNYPLRPSRALRACVYAAEQGVAEPFVSAVMAGYWSQAMDISDFAALQAVADTVGLGPRPIAEIAEDPDYKAAVEANTRTAVDDGLFGVPGFVAGGKLFFGTDRMDLLERHVTGGSGG